jgi:hypothetical protein
MEVVGYRSDLLQEFLNIYSVYIFTNICIGVTSIIFIKLIHNLSNSIVHYELYKI